MKIEFLGAHMFESKDTRLSSILIDDVMAVDAGSLTSALSFEDQAKVEYILLTHGHYDHIRDVAAFALKNQDCCTDIYATEITLKILVEHLINGILYPKFSEWPSKSNPALRLNTVEELKKTKINEYSVIAVPVQHAIPSVGYQITDSNEKSMFFSGDTGPGLSSCWEHISPQVIIMDMGFSNKSADIAPVPGHLCPRLLGEELRDFRKLKGYLPKVIMTHLNPEIESEIREESQLLVQEFGVEIDMAYEGMIVNL